MVSPHGIQLAAHLIASFYGELCAKVCECLIRRGTLTLPQIIRFTELRRENVVNCLRVLIHQNCVQAFTIEEEGGLGKESRVATQYMALFDFIVHKLRLSKFMQIVSQEFDKETRCSEIFQGLLEHGRLSVNQMIDRSAQMDGGSNVHLIREDICKLVDARLIERCPAPDPFLAPPSEEEVAPKKRGAKASKIVQPQLTTEQRAVAAAGPVESLRFLLEYDFSEEGGQETSNKITIGKKRKHDDLMSDEDILDTSRKKEALWRVNFEELVRRLRNKACISYVTRTYDSVAGIVLSAIFKLADLKAGKPASLSIDAINTEVTKTDSSLNMDRIRASLAQLGCNSSQTDFDIYIVDVTPLIEMAQDEEVESVVLRRHGKEAFRIFRYLSKANRYVGTDTIAETNTTSPDATDTIKILNKLWKDDYVNMEKVATSGAKQSDNLLWKVNKKPLREQALDEMYHAALNLRLRITHELDQGKEIVQLPKDKRIGDLGKKFDRLRKVKAILENSFLNLDDSILLFHDFYIQ